MNLNAELPRRQSIRLKGYDYTQPGAYFITLVTHHRREIFGYIEQGHLTPSNLGQMVQEEWFRSAQIRREIQLHEDEFVLMPNHIHGIVWIVDLVGADGVRPHENDSTKEGARRAPLREGKSLASFVAGYKASVTARARRELDIVDIWQRNYYEHIIRTEKAYQNIWNYIQTNPQQWEEDRFASKQ
ncbi:MAG: hypothetical protein JW987_02945 [Anaerolineaceae bacterium]|nr:hypothetical protein [Anaerolineaceae bacterium]